jgi:hypothetical protein
MQKNFNETARRSRQNFDEVSRDIDDTGRSSLTGLGILVAGMVCLALGISMTKFGYMGRVARYVSQEITPVATDTINYVAHETQGGLETVAKSIAAGLAEGARQDRLPGAGSATVAEAGPCCPKCSSANEKTARFCGQCGAPLAAPCPSCGHMSEAGARFCDRCGQKLA